MGKAIQSYEVLEKLPAKTPKWALGAVAIIVSLATSFVTIYMVSQDEIQSYLGWRQAREESSEHAAVLQYETTLKTVLDMVAATQQQVRDVSTKLGETQRENAILTERVAALEKTLETARVSLTICEDKLRICTK